MIFTNKAPWVTMGLFAPLLSGMELPEAKNALFSSSSMSTTLWARDSATKLFLPSESLMMHKDPFGIREYRGKGSLRLLASSGRLALVSLHNQHTYDLGFLRLSALDEMTGRLAYSSVNSPSESVDIFDTQYSNGVSLKQAILGLVWAHTSLVALHENSLVRLDLDETGEPISATTHTIKPIIPKTFSSLRNGFFGGISSDKKHIHIFLYDNASLVDFTLNMPTGCEEGTLRAHEYEGAFLFSVCGKKKIVFFSAPRLSKYSVMPKIEFTLEGPTDETFSDCAIKNDEEYVFATFTKDTDSRAGVRCWKITDRENPYAYWYLPNSAVTRIFQDDTGLIFSDERSLSVVFSEAEPRCIQ